MTFTPTHEPISVCVFTTITRVIWKNERVSNPNDHYGSDRTSQLRLLQQLELRILRCVVDICDSHCLTYYISGGTYLGAVRHQGFIPWDDDIDIALPREDYDTLMEILPRALPSPLTLATFERTPGYYRLWAKVQDPRVHVEVGGGSSIASEPCWIDIFPLDGAPRPGITRELWKLKMRFCELAWVLSRVDQSPSNRAGRSGLKQHLIQIGKTLHLNRFLDAGTWTRRRDRAIRSLPFASSDYCLNAVGAYTLGSIFHIETIYGDGAMYPFEGLSLHGPANFDAYLKQIYGDYLEPPQACNRNWHNTCLVLPKKHALPISPTSW